MKFRLIHKLLIALFASAALVLLLILWVASVNIGRGFEDFLAQRERTLMPEFAAVLGNWYEARGDWTELKQNPRRFHQMLSSTLVELRQGDRLPAADGRAARRPPPSDRPDRKRDRKPPKFRPEQSGRDGALHRRVFLLDPEYRAVIGHSSRQFPKDKLVPVEAGGSVVGWLGVVSPRAMLAPTEQAFVKRMQRVLWLGLGLGLAVAALLAWFLARHLGQPVSAAASGIRKLASGDYSVQVPQHGSDEIAQLSGDVNQLAHSLSENRNARQRWMADMAHELRTPLSIIQGEMEAITDGVRPFNESSLTSIHEEVINLNKLVDDLHLLALSDSGALAYKMEHLNLNELLEACLDSVRHRALEKGIRIETKLPSTPVTVSADELRLRQLVRILLDNALLYTDAPGVIEVTLSGQDNLAVLSVNDSPPGVPKEECDRLFERLYRRESSRNRNSGGSGLGLAIARKVTDAHGGTIKAEPGHLGGLCVKLELPVSS
ncbi:MAG TPA: ATP-binding protein [Xanthomonadales bacterium]|nr:ATP-binding protein [Xanthomonadales bacterium]